MRDHPIDPSRLLTGLETNVFQAKSYPGKPGDWHAHIVIGPRMPNYFEELGIHWMPNPRPWASVSGATDAEVRTKAAAMIGRLYGAALAKAWQPYKPPQPSVIAPPRALEF